MLNLIIFYFKLNYFLFLFLIIIIFNLIIFIFNYIFLLFFKIVSGYTIVSWSFFVVQTFFIFFMF